MSFNWLRARPALRDVRTSVWVRSDLRAFARLHFLSVAEQTGLLAALSRPASAAQLADKLEVADADLLTGLLEVGVAVKELDRRGGRYRLRGNRIRAMAQDSADAYRAMVVELADYHGSVYHHLPARLHGAPRGRYLDRYDEVVALSTAFMSPYIAHFVQQV